MNKELESYSPNGVVASASWGTDYRLVLTEPAWQLATLSQVSFLGIAEAIMTAELLATP
jgi:hypothetical protein